MAPPPDLTDQRMLPRVCHLTSVHGPHDVRIFQKMCVSLAERGYEVHLVVANAAEEVKDGVHIQGVEVPFSGRLSRMRKAARAVYERGLEIDADIYHVHDPELIPFAVKLQKRGKKVIFDSHEDVPQDILDKTYLGPLLVRKFISSVYNAYEKVQVRRLSGVISVLDSITAKFKHPHSETIHNFPRIDFFGSGDYKLNPSLQGHFKLVYNGGLSSIRGIHHMVEAMNYLDDRFRLLLMGPWESQNYEIKCRNISGWSRSVYLGMLPIRDCFAVLTQCDLGLVVFRAVPNHLQSLPNKSFEFIASRLPMLMSDFPFWKEEFGSYAHFVNPEDPQAIAHEVMRIAALGDKERERVGEVSAQFLATKTWRSEEKKLFNFYEKLT